MLRAEPRRATLFAWLRVVAIHEAYRLCDALRQPHLEDFGDSDGWDALIATRESIDDAIEARRALRLLAELPARQREDLSLLVAGFTYAEIRASTGGRTSSNVNRHLTKARANIRLADRPTAEGARAKRSTSS